MATFDVNRIYSAVLGNVTIDENGQIVAEVQIVTGQK